MRVSSNRGEIITILTIGTFLVLGISTLLSATLLKNKTPTQNSKAAASYTRYPDVSAPAGYYWEADINTWCDRSSICPKNDTAHNYPDNGYVQDDSSNYCYGFDSGDPSTYRCMMLHNQQYYPKNGTTPTPMPSVNPTCNDSVQQVFFDKATRSCYVQTNGDTDQIGCYVRNPGEQIGRGCQYISIRTIDNKRMVVFNCNNVDPFPHNNNLQVAGLKYQACQINNVMDWTKAKYWSSINDAPGSPEVIAPTSTPTPGSLPTATPRPEATPTPTEQIQTPGGGDTGGSGNQGNQGEDPNSNTLSCRNCISQTDKAWIGSRIGTDLNQCVDFNADTNQFSNSSNIGKELHFWTCTNDNTPPTVNQNWWQYYPEIIDKTSGKAHLGRVSMDYYLQSVLAKKSALQTQCLATLPIIGQKFPAPNTNCRSSCSSTEQSVTSFGGLSMSCPTGGVCCIPKQTVDQAKPPDQPAADQPPPASKPQTSYHAQCGTGDNDVPEGTCKSYYDTYDRVHDWYYCINNVLSKSFSTENACNTEKDDKLDQKNAITFNVNFNGENMKSYMQGLGIQSAVIEVFDINDPAYDINNPALLLTDKRIDNLNDFATQISLTYHNPGTGSFKEVNVRVRGLVNDQPVTIISQSDPQRNIQDGGTYSYTIKDPSAYQAELAKSKGIAIVHLKTESNGLKAYITDDKIKKYLVATIYKTDGGCSSDCSNRTAGAEDITVNDDSVDITFKNLDRFNAADIKANTAKYRIKIWFVTGSTVGIDPIFDSQDFQFDANNISEITKEFNSGEDQKLDFNSYYSHFAFTFEKDPGSSNQKFNYAPDLTISMQGYTYSTYFTAVDITEPTIVRYEIDKRVLLNPFDPNNVDNENHIKTTVDKLMSNGLAFYFFLNRPAYFDVAITYQCLPYTTDASGKITYSIPPPPRTATYGDYNHHMKVDANEITIDHPIKLLCN